MQARDRVVEALLERVEIPMPEHVLADEISYRKQSMGQQLEQIGTTREAYAEIEGKSVEELAAVASAERERGPRGGGRRDGGGRDGGGRGRDGGGRPRNRDRDRDRR